MTSTPEENAAATAGTTKPRRRRAASRPAGPPAHLEPTDAAGAVAGTEPDATPVAPQEPPVAPAGPPSETVSETATETAVETAADETPAPRRRARRATRKVATPEAPAPEVAAAETPAAETPAVETPAVAPEEPAAEAPAPTRRRRARKAASAPAEVPAEPEVAPAVAAAEDAPVEEAPVQAPADVPAEVTEAPAAEAVEEDQADLMDDPVLLRAAGFARGARRGGTGEPTADRAADAAARATALFFQAPDAETPPRRRRASAPAGPPPGARATDDQDHGQDHDSVDTDDSTDALDGAEGRSRDDEVLDSLRDLRRTRGGRRDERDELEDESDDDENEDGEDSDESEESDEDTRDEDGGAPRRRRRRGGRGRRSRGRDSDDRDDRDDRDDEPGAEAAEDTASEDASEDEDDSADGPDDGEEQSGSSRRRRRRRRRGGSGEGDDVSGDDPPNTVTRVREPRRPRGTGEDEVTALRGSTRLEAKKQRRREGREAGRKRAILTEAEFLARREAVERVMVVRQQDDRTQIGVLEDKVLVEHYGARQAQTSMVGNVYLGRVQNVLPSMEAAFVDVGKGRNAVLYAGEVNWDAAGLEGQPRRIEAALKSGDPVLVQVTKDPVGHKGARLTSQVSLPGRYLVYVPRGSMTGISRKLPDTERARLKKVLKEVVPPGAGVIVRTAAEGVDEDELRADVQRLQATWEAIQAKAQSKNAPLLLHGEPDLTVRVVRDVFNEDFTKVVVSGEQAWEAVHGYVADVAPDLAERLERWEGSQDVFEHFRIDEQLQKALGRKVWLPSGGSLVIDPTEAMHVIDVNTGKFTGAGGTLEETVTRNNLEAAEEIVRQLRLRDIGGIIVIDFIDMVLESNRDLVLRRLVECLGRDRTKHQVAEVTSLGLVQMTRKRTGQGLAAVLEELDAAADANPAPQPAPSSNGGGGGNGNGNGNGSGNGKSRRRRGRDRSADDAPRAESEGPDGGAGKDSGREQAKEPAHEPAKDAAVLAAIAAVAAAGRRERDTSAPGDSASAPEPASPPAGE
ncbi:Rne/Rng family ribonuclease [Kineococcus endophyticus]|uniref:Rne/Rng family ribonuclease n=1 Tax=Kineococcus endophyticus TaxID=1181883 RepID=UPI003F5984B9